MKSKKMIILPLVLFLISCSDSLNGEWKSFVATNENIISTSNIKVTPFNTVMQLRYFLNNSNENNEEIFDNVSNIFNNEVARLHKQFDRHNNYNIDDSKDILNNIKVINDSFGTGNEIKCSDELYELLKLGIESYEITDGMFNIFTGSITDYWDDIFHEAYNYGLLSDIDPYFNESQRLKLESLVESIPSNIEEVNKQLTFNDENKSVIFNKCDFNNNQNIIISVGGIGKGYATDLIKKQLVANNYVDGYLISGGSSITTLAKPIYSEKEKGQKVSIVNPAKSNIIEKEMAFSLRLSEEFSFSTSGNYTAYKNYKFVDDDNNLIYRHHIINPHTGYPESYYRSISIFTSYFSNAFVDAFSTAFMNLSIEEGLKLKNKILSKYENSNLEIVYISQVGNDDVAKVSVHSTSDFNKTLETAKGVTLVYEK